jgi:putative colanic acid biosysnthesis UDP-glucose lipid carrier transferase
MINRALFEDTVLLAGVRKTPLFILLYVVIPAVIALTFYLAMGFTILETPLHLHLLACSSFASLYLARSANVSGGGINSARMTQSLQVLGFVIRHFLLIALIATGTGAWDQIEVGKFLTWAAYATLASTSVYFLGLKALMHPRFRAVPMRVLVVGLSKSSLNWVRRVQGDSYYSMNIIGFADDRASQRDSSEQSIKPIGLIKDVRQLCEQHQIDRVMIGLPSNASARIASVLEQLKDSVVSVYSLRANDGFEPLGMRIEASGDMTAVSLIESPTVTRAWFVKCWAERVAATLMIMLISPLLMAIAAAIKLDSKGPVFFRQNRYGNSGQSFRIWKFRSMTVAACSPDAFAQATKNDARVTRVGAFIRKTSLDELPQLFNVAAGQMSFVGPRPHANAQNEEYRKVISGYMLRHKINPGITGLAQVRGFRGETETLDKMADRVNSDLEYIRQWSIGLDLKILFQTPLSLIFNKNVY